MQTKMALFQEQLKGKRVVLTAAGKGLGRELVTALHNIGAQVYGVTRSQAGLDSLLLDCPNVHPIQLDISSWDDTKRILTEKLPPTVDVLINNAAVVKIESHLNITSDGFDRIMITNVKALINTCQVIVSKMIAAGTEGIIINVSPITGIHPVSWVPVYSASKAALDALTKTMATEFGKHKIRVIGFHPAGIPTNMYTAQTDQVGPAETEKVMTNLSSRVPLGDFMMPMDQVVNMILFLASGFASKMTGSSVVLDGGFLVT